MNAGVIRELTMVAVETAELTRIVKSLANRKHRISNWMKDGMFEFHETDLKCGQFGTGTLYKNGGKTMLRTYKTIHGNICIVFSGKKKQEWQSPFIIR